MDALVIACATKDHINLLNNQSAKSETKRYDLQYKLRTRESYFNKKEQRQKDAFKDFGPIVKQDMTLKKRSGSQSSDCD